MRKPCKEKMEMQQMMEFFCKELRADREYFMARMEASRKKDKEEMEAIKARTKAMREEMGTSHMEMVSECKPKTEIKTMACQEMEARQEEKPTSLDRKPEAAEERHVPEENAEVIPVGEPRKKRCRDRQLAQKTPTDRKMCCRATVARHKRDIVKSYLPQEKCRPRKELSLLELGRATVQQWHGKVTREAARRCPIAQQWHDARETPSCRT
jgi:hypothetical protein